MLGRLSGELDRLFRRRSCSIIAQSDLTHRDKLSARSASPRPAAFHLETKTDALANTLQERMSPFYPLVFAVEILLGLLALSRLSVLRCAPQPSAEGPRLTCYLPQIRPTDLVQHPLDARGPARFPVERWRQESSRQEQRRLHHFSHDWRSLCAGFHALLCASKALLLPGRP